MFINFTLKLTYILTTVYAHSHGFIKLQLILDPLSLYMFLLPTSLISDYQCTLAMSLIINPITIVLNKLI